MEKSTQNHTARKCNHSKTYNTFSSYGSNKLKAMNKTNRVEEFNNAYTAYLKRTKEFCENLVTKQHLSLKLTAKEVLEIVLVADRLHIERLDALKAWGVCKKGVIIDPRFLASFFVSADMLSSVRFYIDSKKEVTYILELINDKEVIGRANYNDYIDNTIWKAEPKKAISELALMQALRKAFPDTLMGIICESEVPPTRLSQLKSLLVFFSQKLLEFCNYLFIGFITLMNRLGRLLVKKTTKEIDIRKADNATKDEDMFLDFDDLKVKSKNYETSPLN